MIVIRIARRIGVIAQRGVIALAAALLLSMSVAGGSAQTTDSAG